VMMTLRDTPIDASWMACHFLRPARIRRLLQTNRRPRWHHRSGTWHL